mgnify:CR=1 FL=1
MDAYSNFNFTNTDTDAIDAEDYDHLSLLNMVAVCLLAFGTNNVVKQIWRKGHPNSTEGFRSTFLYGATNSVAISSRVYVALMVLDFALHHVRTTAALSSMVLPENSSVDLRQAAPAVAAFLWAGLSACTIKRVLLLQSVAGKRLGRVALFDRFLDFCIMVVTALNVLDTLKVDLSTGMQSILSMGGVGALVFSLASKDLAEGLVGGFALNAWDAFNVGDLILLGDGTEGFVDQVGLIETHIKGYDNVVTRIPNGQLTTARVANLSRVSRSRIVQNIRFKYSDLPKLETVLEDIKTEIKASCPKVITDGSAAFFAVLEEYKSDHVSGLIIANFEIKPRTLEFIDNRQHFMVAVARAMKKNHVEFAIPSVEYNHTSSDGNIKMNSKEASAVST